jgi:Putative zinc-finger
MDHTEAIQGRFTERYLLGELTPAQRDQFEEHFFDCAICAEDVQAGAVFVDSARALVRGGPFPEEAASSITQGAFTRFGVPFQAAAWAFVGLLFVAGYENIVTIPKLRAHSVSVRAPEILPAVSLLGMGARAEANPADAPALKDFMLELEIPGGPEFTDYVCEIRDAKGQLKFSIPVTVEQAKDTLRLAIPGSTLSAGNYEVVVLGERPSNPSKKLTQYPVFIH